MSLAFAVFLALGVVVVVVVSQDSCPSSCYCDSELTVYCVGDSLWTFPEDIPSGAIRLQLRNYVIETLKRENLYELRNLTELTAPQNSISTVEDGTFQDLKLLEKLDLSQNSISQICAETFTGAGKLRNLDLSSNLLTECDGAFTNLAFLEQLTLSGNNLTSLGPKTFDGLFRLQYLNLDSNSIADIDVSAFQTLPALAHLILSNNPLANLSRLEFFGSRLQYIDVSAVGLSRIPQALTQYVRDLRLAKNNFTILRRGDFDSYPQLGLLVLDDSGITMLEDDILGRHEYLMRLWLNGNQLSSVPKSLPPALKALYLEENKITALKANDFRGLTSLDQLFIQRNLITTIESCAFCGLSSLKGLDLQANNIGHLSEGSFSGLEALESIDLSQNPITVIDDKAFSSFTSLKDLRLSRIKENITMPDPLFDPLQRLEKLEMFDSPMLVERFVSSGRLIHGVRNIVQLNVLHNKLSSLRQDLPSLLPKLTLVKLGGSWWNCSDPDILWLTDWMTDSRVQFYNPLSVRCRYPQRLIFKSVALLQNTDFGDIPTNPPQTESSVSTATIEETTLDQDSDAEESRENSPTTSPVSSTSAATSTAEVTARLNITTPTAEPAPVTRSTQPPPTEQPTTQTEATTRTATASRTIALTAAPTVSSSTQRPPPSLPTTSTTLTSSSPSAAPSSSSPSTTTTTSSTASTTQRLNSISRLGEEDKQLMRPAQTAGSVGYKQSGKKGTNMAILTSLAAAVAVLLVVVLSWVCVWRFRQVPVYPLSRRRKNSSISYSQQKDEVNIEHEGCGSEEVTSDTHHGLSNVLYFMSQSGEADFSNSPRPRPSGLTSQTRQDTNPPATSQAWGSPNGDNRW